MSVLIGCLLFPQLKNLTEKANLNIELNKFANLLGLSLNLWIEMEYLGDKLSVAHSQMSGWMGNVRRSFQGALNLVSSSVERRSGGGGGEEGGGFKRAASLRSLASRSRESFRRFSLRSQQRLSLRRRTTSLASPSTPSSVRETICNFYLCITPKSLSLKPSITQHKYRVVHIDTLSLS